jgi:uncharacterized protein
MLVFGDDLAGGRLALADETSEKCAIFGVSGSGKSYLAGRLAEEWLVSGRRVAVIDPVGIFYGLRTGAEGNPAHGMPLTIYGGMRGDANLPDPFAAAHRLALAHDTSCVYDLSAVTFEYMHWWVAHFLNKLGELGPWIQTPLHLIFEEAPMLAPQTGSLSRYQRDCKAAMAQCARVYRNFGVGMTVVAQRASAISKDVLTQCGTAFVMRIAAKLDRRALTDWCASNAADVDVDSALKKLSVMQPGHGMVLSPTWGPEISGNTFRSLPRTTYHPDPRRLAQNRAVALSAPPPSLSPHSRWRSAWNTICGIARLVP